MKFRLGVIVVCAISALALAACRTTDAPHPTPGTTGGSGAPGASPGGDGGGAGTAAPVSYPDSADAYAKAAVQAWSTGDHTRLTALDDPADSLFGTLSSGDYDTNFALYQCTGAAGSSICVFYNDSGDEADLRLRNDRVGQAHAVVDGQLHAITFPTDYQAYGQEALDAWLKHNTAAVALLTGKTGDSAFDAVPAGLRNQTWTYHREEGATGHQFYLWRNADGDAIAIGFIDPGFVTVPPNRHGLIETVVFAPHL